MVGVIQDHIEIVRGEGGPKARVVGHRVRVQDVVIWHEKLGLAPDEILHRQPTLTLADVYSALAYYWDHRDEIEQAIAEEQDLVQELRRGHAGPVQEKLKRPRRG